MYGRTVSGSIVFYRPSDCVLRHLLLSLRLWSECWS